MDTSIVNDLAERIDRAMCAEESEEVQVFTGPLSSMERTALWKRGYEHISNDSQGYHTFRLR